MGRDFLAIKVSRPGHRDHQPHPMSKASTPSASTWATSSPVCATSTSSAGTRSARPSPRGGPKPSAPGIGPWAATLTRRVPYDFEAINHQLRFVVAEDWQWQMHFERYGITPLTVYYGLHPRPARPPRAHRPVPRRTGHSPAQFVDRIQMMRRRLDGAHRRAADHRPAPPPLIREVALSALYGLTTARVRARRIARMAPGPWPGPNRAPVREPRRPDRRPARRQCRPRTRGWTTPRWGPTRRMVADDDLEGRHRAPHVAAVRPTRREG